LYLHDSVSLSLENCKSLRCWISRLLVLTIPVFGLRNYRLPTRYRACVIFSIFQAPFRNFDTILTLHYLRKMNNFSPSLYALISKYQVRFSFAYKHKKWTIQEIRIKFCPTVSIKQSTVTWVDICAADIWVWRHYMTSDVSLTSLLLNFGQYYKQCWCMAMQSVIYKTKYQRMYCKPSVIQSSACQEMIPRPQFAQVRTSALVTSA